MKTLAFTVALATGATALAGPGDPNSPGDKSRHHLFNPVPASLMRELSTDRPDQTESPFTVDAGHFQVEMDFFNFTRDRRGTGGAHTEAWNVAPINLKAGLLNNVDLQVLLDNYLDVRTNDPATQATRRTSGFGDLTLRLKVNVWGNDGGATALAIMPVVKLPLPASSLRNGGAEAGVIVPFALALPGGWSMGLMTEVDFVSDGAGGHDTEWVNSITFSRDLTRRIGAYVEFFTVTGDAPGFQWQGQADVGFTCALNDNVQFDVGCNFGVTASAPDYNPFVGLSIRF